MNPQWIRLKSGEEIIARVVDGLGCLTFKDALMIGFKPPRQPDEPPVLILEVAFPFAKDPREVVIPRDAIYWAIDANEQLAAAYVQRTSGLILPS